MFELLISIAIFLVLLLVIKRTRVGLVVQAALSHPDMVGMLGHNVDRVFMLVFGVGAGLAAVAGVIAGPALVTQSNMAASLGPILFVVVVVGGLGSLGGAFVASLLIGLIQTFAVASNASLAGALRRAHRQRPVRRVSRRHLERHGGAGRTDPALPAAGAGPDLQAARPHGNARNHERSRKNARHAICLPSQAQEPRRELRRVDRGRGGAAAAAAGVQLGARRSARCA